MASCSEMRSPVRISSVAFERPISRLAEPDSLRSESDVATHGQLEAPAQADPINRRDDRFGTCLDLVEDRLSPHRHLRPFTGRRDPGKHPDIRAGNEEPAGSSHNDGFDDAVGSQRIKGSLQFKEQVQSQRVGWRMIQRQRCHAVFNRSREHGFGCRGHVQSPRASNS